MKSRVGTYTNAEVVSGLDDLRNLINVLISTVSESFVKEIREKAGTLFFAQKDHETLYYREKIAERINAAYEKELGALPEQGEAREQDQIEIGAPRFLKKEHQRFTG